MSYDLRGYGLSSWSPSQDYSLDATLLDVGTMLDHLGWRRPILVGHSRGGSFALRFAHEHPERVGGLVLVDYSPSPSPGRPGIAPLHEGSWGPVYESIDQAHAATSRNPAELESDDGYARAESIFAPRDGGWVNIRRDPAFRNERPNDRPDWRSTLAPVDPWDALSGLVRLGTPVLVARATRSPPTTRPRWSACAQISRRSRSSKSNPDTIFRAPPPPNSSRRSAISSSLRSSDRRLAQI